MQHDDRVLSEVFANPPTSTAMRSSALARAAAEPIGADVVAGCLDPADPGDHLFERAWRSGPASLMRRERCIVAGVTGHVAESVAELVLDGLGWRVLWHFTGRGGHGVDLVFLAPDGRVVAVEVKGTLVRGRVPRLSRREQAQDLRRDRSTNRPG